MVVITRKGGKVFVKQTTYYVYNNEKDYKQDKYSVVTSNEKTFTDIKNKT